MPITPSKVTADPYASLAWSASVVVLALEKLRRDIPIKEKEQQAVKKMAEQLSLLSAASQIRFNDPNKAQVEAFPGHLQDSFFTLVAIGEISPQSGQSPTFKEAGENLQLIYEHLESGRTNSLDSKTLERAQNVCLELLEDLNRQRPNSTIR